MQCFPSLYFKYVDFIFQEHLFPWIAGFRTVISCHFYLLGLLLSAGCFWLSPVFVLSETYLPFFIFKKNLKWFSSFQFPFLLRCCWLCLVPLIPLDFIFFFYFYFFLILIHIVSHSLNVFSLFWNSTWQLWSVLWAYSCGMLSLSARMLFYFLFFFFLLTLLTLDLTSLLTLIPELTSAVAVPSVAVIQGQTCEGLPSASPSCPVLSACLPYCLSLLHVLQVLIPPGGPPPCGVLSWKKHCSSPSGLEEEKPFLCSTAVPCCSAVVSPESCSTFWGNWCWFPVFRIIRFLTAPVSTCTHTDVT